MSDTTTTEPQAGFYDPSPRDFANALFAGMKAAMADIDARAEKRAAAKKQKRLADARKTRANAVHELPAAFERAVDSLRLKRTDFDGGFHIESADDDYRPYAGDMLRITYTVATGVITATRKPNPGRPEQSRPVTAYGTLRLLREFVASVKENTPAPSYGDEGCQCPNIANPPCWRCENWDWCEDCNTLVDPDLRADHLETHEQEATVNA